jgi:hypothetical protein
MYQYTSENIGARPPNWVASSSYSASTRTESTTNFGSTTLSTDIAITRSTTTNYSGRTTDVNQVGGATFDTDVTDYNTSYRTYIISDDTSAVTNNNGSQTTAADTGVGSSTVTATSESTWTSPLVTYTWTDSDFYSHTQVTTYTTDTTLPTWTGDNKQYTTQSTTTWFFDTTEVTEGTTTWTDLSADSVDWTTQDSFTSYASPAVTTTRHRWIDQRGTIVQPDWGRSPAYNREVLWQWNGLGNSGVYTDFYSSAPGAVTLSPVAIQTSSEEYITYLTSQDGTDYSLNGGAWNPSEAKSSTTYTTQAYGSTRSYFSDTWNTWDRSFLSTVTFTNRVSATITRTTASSTGSVYVGAVTTTQETSVREYVTAVVTAWDENTIGVKASATATGGGNLGYTTSWAAGRTDYSLYGTYNVLEPLASYTVGPVNVIWRRVSPRGYAGFGVEYTEGSVPAVYSTLTTSLIDGTFPTETTSDAPGTTEKYQVTPYWFDGVQIGDYATAFNTQRHWTSEGGIPTGPGFKFSLDPSTTTSTAATLRATYVDTTTRKAQVGNSSLAKTITVPVSYKATYKVGVNGGSISGTYVQEEAINFNSDATAGIPGEAGVEGGWDGGREYAYTDPISVKLPPGKVYITYVGTNQSTTDGGVIGTDGPVSLTVSDAFFFKHWPASTVREKTAYPADQQVGRVDNANKYYFQ